MDEKEKRKKKRGKRGALSGAGADDGCGRGACAPRESADDGCGRGARAPRVGALSGGEWEEMGRGLLPIHVREAVAVLRDGEAHWVRAWKQKDGSLIEYRRARMVGEHVRGGVVRLRMEGSGLVRAMRWVCMVGIDGVEVYL